MTKKDVTILSLKDDKGKKIAKALSNKTSKKILELLEEKEYTESEIAKKLNLAANTVNYNIKILKEADIIEANKYHYSSKGREVQHYSLTQKLILISPFGNDNKKINEFLKSITPSILLVVLGAIGIYLFEKSSITNEFTKENTRVMSSDQSVAIAIESTPQVSSTLMNIPEPIINLLLGAFLAIVGFFLYFRFKD